MKDDASLHVLSSLKVEPEMLFRFGLERARQGFARGTSRRRALKADEIPAWQAETRRKIVEMVGGFPERTPLGARVTGVLERRGYVVEKLVYESRPGFHVTANLYLPTSAPSPAPCCLFPCGHSAEGKAAEAYQLACISLALNGYAVLCYDPLGQGERSQYWDARRKRSRVGLCTPEHGMAGAQCVLLGTNLAQWRIWDGIRSIDYLTSRPEVDAGKLLVTGNSGGGTLTSYIAAVDPRVAIAAPGCYITTLEERFLSRLGADAEQNLLPQSAWGIDHVDYLAVMAPKPVIICAAKKDFFPIKGARWAHGELKRLYSKLGAAARPAKAESPFTHGFTQPLREAMVNFANKHFATGRPKWREPKIKIEREKDLLCTKTGQVATSLGSRTVFDFNLNLAAAAPELPTPPSERSALAGYREALRGRILKLLRLQLTSTRPAVRRAGMFERGPLRVERLAVTSERGILVPGLLYRTPGERSAVTVVLACDGGKAEVAKRRGLAERLARTGLDVFAVDVRGIGETRSVAKGWSHRGDEWIEHDLAFQSWMYDYPLIAGRALDLIRSCEAVARLRGARVLLVADGVRTATPALFAAALGASVAGCVARGPLASYRQLTQTEIWSLPLAVMIPGVMGSFDLGDVAGLAAPKQLAIAGAVGADGKTLSAARARKLGLGRAEGLYKAARARRALAISGPASAAAFEKLILRAATGLAK